MVKSLLEKCQQQHESLRSGVRLIASKVTPEDKDAIKFLRQFAIGDRCLAVAVRLGIEENDSLPEDCKKAIRDCQSAMGMDETAKK